MIRATLFLLALLAFAPCLAPAEIVAEPAATAEQWVVNPEGAARAAGAQAERTGRTWGAAGFWAGLAAVGLTALAVFRRVAPLIPGLGPVYQAAGDSVWNLLATVQAKRADQAAQRARVVVDAAAPSIRLLRDLQPETWHRLDPALRASLEAIASLSPTPTSPNART